MRALTLRTPFPVALPLLISVLMLCGIRAQLMLFYVHAQRAVRNTAEQNLLQAHERITDRMRGYFEIAERVSHVGRETVEMDHWARRDLASWRGGKPGLDRRFNLLRACAHLPATEIRDRVAVAEQTFRDGAPQGDDISFVIIKITGAGSS
jgi:hypothetical protein